MKHSQYRFGIAVSLLVWAAPAAAGASEIDAATRDRLRSLMNDGGALFEQNQFEAARSKWLEAFSLIQIPTAALWAARASAKLGNLVAAEKLYQGALVLKPNLLWKGDTQQKAQAEAKQELEALKPRIPSLNVAIEGYVAPDEVTLDEMKLDLSGGPFVLPLDPGTHVLIATHDGRSVTESVTLAESEHLSLHVKPPVEAPSKGASPTATVVQPPSSNEAHPVVATPPSTNKSIASYAMWTSFGLGAAGLVLGATTGAFAWDKHSSLVDAGCSNTQCSDDNLGDRMNSYNDFRTVSMIGFVVAGVGAAAGITLWLTRPKQASAPSVGFMLSPTGFGATGNY